VRPPCKPKRESHADKLARCFVAFIATLASAAVGPEDVIAFWESRNAECTTRTMTPGHYDCEEDCCPYQLQYETLLAYHWQLRSTPTGLQYVEELNNPDVKRWRAALRRRQHLAGRVVRPATPILVRDAEAIALTAYRKLQHARKHGNLREAVKWAQWLTVFVLDLTVGRRNADITCLLADRAFTTLIEPGNPNSLRRLHLELLVQKVLTSNKYCYVDERGPHHLLCPLRWLDIYLALAGRVVCFGRPQAGESRPYITPYVFPQFVYDHTSSPHRINMRERTGGLTPVENPTYTTTQANATLRQVATAAGLGHLTFTINGTRSALALVANACFAGDRGKINQALGWSKDSMMSLRYMRATQVYVSFARSAPTIDEVTEAMSVPSNITLAPLAR
jgi:hypothetical protein